MAVNRNTAKNYNLQGGELFFKLKENENFTYFGATNEFKLGFKSTTVEHKNSESDTIVTDLEVVKEVEATASFTTEDLNKSVLEMAFGGVAVENKQEASIGSVITFEAIKAKEVYELGKYKVLNVEVFEEIILNLNKGFTSVQLETEYALDKTNVFDVVVKYDDDDDDSTEDATAVLDTDYSLNSENGIITIIDNDVLKDKDISVTYKAIEKNLALLDADYSVNAMFGTIEIAENSDFIGKTVKVIFDNEAETVTSYSSLNETSREFSLRFISKPKNGKAKQTTIHRVRLSLNGDYSLKDLEKYTSLSFDGKVLQDTTKSDGQQFVETIELG